VMGYQIKEQYPLMNSNAVVYHASQQSIRAPRRLGQDHRRPRAAAWISVLHEFFAGATRLARGHTRIMTVSFYSKYAFLRIALALLFSAIAYRASAQVTIPELREGPQIRVFATFSDVKPNHNYFNDLAVYGFSMGGYLQTRHVLGGELRGSITRWGAAQHEESILAGPRAALHFGRVSPYLSLLGGVGNAWSWSNPRKPGLPPPTITEEIGGQWMVLGGLDVHLKNRLTLRVGELSYSEIYLKGKTLNPLSASAGIVFRPRLGRGER
jgi:hypothetical protein